MWTINQHARLYVPGIARSAGFSWRSHIDHFIQTTNFRGFFAGAIIALFFGFAADAIETAAEDNWRLTLTGRARRSRCRDYRAHDLEHLPVGPCRRRTHGPRTGQVGRRHRAADLNVATRPGRSCPDYGPLRKALAPPNALREKATAPACRSDVVTHAFHDVATFLSSARRPPI